MLSGFILPRLRILHDALSTDKHNRMIQPSCSAYFSALHGDTLSLDVRTMALIAHRGRRPTNVAGGALSWAGGSPRLSPRVNGLRYGAARWRRIMPCQAARFSADRTRI